MERDFYLIEEERRALQLEREGMEKMKKAMEVESIKLQEQISIQIQTAKETERSRAKAVLLQAGRVSEEQLLCAQVRFCWEHHLCPAVDYGQLER